MRIQRTLRGLLSIVLAAALFFSALPRAAMAEETEETTVPEESAAAGESAQPAEIAQSPEPNEATVAAQSPETIEPIPEPKVFTQAQPAAAVYRRIQSLNAFTSGQYILITDDGYAPGVLWEDWVTAVQPVAEEDSVTDPLGAVWMLTVGDGTVTLTDSNGTTISPGANNENSITSGDYGWNVTCENGFFTFYGTSGGETVTLASSKSVDPQFRAYRDSTIAVRPESYSGTFALYKQEDTAPENLTVSTVAQAKAMAAGTRGITLQGTLVLADGDCCILQDATGGIRLSFAAAPSAVPGDVFLVTGTKSDDFAVTMYEKTGTAVLPATEVTIEDILADQGVGTLESTRVVIKNAVLRGGTLTQGEMSIPITVPERVTDGEMAEVYAVIVNDNGYQLRIVSAGDIIPVSVFTETADRDWNLYFGQLHAHSDLSDGALSPAEVFSNAVTEGLDFLAVTDHSNSFDNDEAGSIDIDGTSVSSSWAAGKAAAAAVSDEAFVGIFGYEMTWQERKRLGHISTFNTPGWQSRNQVDYADQATALETYYQALTAVPGSISQFNHPGTAYGSFENFGHYSAACDDVMKLLEVGSDGGYAAYEYYTQALDKGWHVAPTNNHFTHAGSLGSARTVILADTLTEAGLYEAMASYRVYATEDSDLTIYYQLDGHIMGSILHGAPSPEISVYLCDPTDTTIGTVEVIADGGVVAAAQTVLEACATVTFTVPGGYSYYYIRVTQPDGDVAVTAPVWVDSMDDMGISGFTASTALPVQGQNIGLTVELYNNETVDFTVNSIEFSIDGEIIHTATAPGTVYARDTFAYAFPYTHPGMGVTEIRAVVNGIVNGESRTYTETLTLRYRTADMVTGILVDGAHGNFGVTALRNLASVAAEANVSVTVFAGDLPDSGNLLIVSAPSMPFEEDFLTKAAEFVKSGGSLIVCGRSDAGDGTLHTSGELNRLLTAVGSTLRLNDDTAIDKVNNGGQPDALYPTVFNTGSSWCKDISDAQFYSQHSGCTVDAGSGIWLVKAPSTAQSADMDGDGLGGSGAVLLACEEITGGGTVLAAGSLFLSDTEMEEPQNRWDPVCVNQVILDKLLDLQRAEYSLCSISDARDGELGEIYRIRGYATAGTSNKYNTFPDTIYIQDDTGGIAVVPFTETGIQLGTPIEVVGYLDVRQGNPVLEILDYAVLDEDVYRYVPKTVPHKTAMDYAANGGELQQVEGTVVEVECTADKKGVARFTVKDGKGDLATVLIEDYIRSGASGLNELASEVKKGRTVRAIGILHLDTDGEPVLRVRDCDEVVYVPPVPQSGSPHTGDNIRFAGGVMAVSFAALAVLLPIFKKRKM